MSHSDLDGRILACTLAALMCSPQLSLISLLLTCHYLSFHLNAVEAPDPKEASGREWCYVEPQAGSGKVWGRFRTTFRTTGSRKVPGQVPNYCFQEVVPNHIPKHGFQEGSGGFRTTGSRKLPGAVPNHGFRGRFWGTGFRWDGSRTVLARFLDFRKKAYGL